MPWLRAHNTTMPDRTEVGIEDDRQLVWAMIVEIGLNERHFNQLQTSYRALASTWLLGLFAAAGFLLSRKGSDLPLNPGAVLAFLGLIACVGIVLLWLIDLRVYAGLLRAFFDAGVALEVQHPWLPQVRTIMLDETRKLGPGPKVARFYLAAAVACIATSCIGGFRAIDLAWGRYLWVAVCLLGSVLVGLVMITKSGRTRRKN